MRHYRTISVVLAAGASREMGKPTSPEVVDAFDALMSPLNPQTARRDSLLYAMVKRTLTPMERGDFEIIFDRLSLDPEDARIRGTPKAKKRLFRILREHFGKMLLAGDMGAGNHLKKLCSLPLHLGYALHVVTTNQDTCVEQSADPNAPVVDGFWGRGPDHLWDVEIFYVKGTGLVICLHKLHGSVNWQRTPAGKFFSTDPSQEIDVTKAALVLGHKEKTLAKLPYTFEFQAKMFVDVNADLIVVIGFGFRDEHVIELLLGGLRRRADVLVVTPETSPAQEVFLERARELHKDADPSLAPGRVFLLRKTAKEFFMGLPESLQQGIPDGSDGA